MLLSRPSRRVLSCLPKPVLAHSNLLLPVIIACFPFSFALLVRLCLFHKCTSWLRWGKASSWSSDCGLLSFPAWDLLVSFPVIFFTLQISPTSSRELCPPVYSCSLQVALTVAQPRSHHEPRLAMSTGQEQTDGGDQGPGCLRRSPSLHGRHGCRCERQPRKRCHHPFQRHHLCPSRPKSP